MNEFEQQLQQVFAHLHEHPEVSFEEHETTRFLAEQLHALGLTVRTFDDVPGVVAEWGTGSPCVALRADMDALWQMVDGEWRANHSCGHDAHMTMVLGAVQQLLARVQHQGALPGKVKVIFQPAEETGCGALKMVELGVVDDVDYLYGVHVRPVQELAGGYCAPALHHGAVQFVEGTIISTAAHAARPHLGVNAIEVAAALVQAAANVHADPQVPHSLKMTKLQAGGGNGNTIPDRAEFTFDLRAQTNAVMEQLLTSLTRMAAGLGKVYGAEIALRPGATIVAAEVSAEAQDLMERAIRQVIGAERCAAPITTSGGEDFHFYTKERPQLRATMLGLGCELRPGLHHPQMTFDRAELATGAQILAQVVVETFAAVGKGAR